MAYKNKKQERIYKVVGFKDADYIVDGTNDELQINQAISEVNLLGCGTVYIKKGTYDINSDFIKLLPNVTLVGDGEETILKRNPASSITVTIQAYTNIGTSIDNIGIRNLKINGSESSSIAGHANIIISTGAVAGVTSINNILIENVISINSSSSGIYLQGVNYGNLNKLKIETALQSITFDGISMKLCNNISIDSVDLKTGDDGIAVTSCSYINANKITNNGAINGSVFRVAGNTDNILQSSNITASNLIAKNCAYCLGVTSVGTLLQPISNLSFSNIVAEGGQYAVIIKTNGGLQDGVTFPFNNIEISNVVSVGQETGIVIGQTSLHSVKNLSISGVVIRDTSSNGINLFSGNSVTFSNVRVLNSAGRGINCFIDQTAGNNFAKNIKFIDINVSNSAGYGVLFGTQGSSPEVYQPDFHLENSIIENNALTGVFCNKALHYVSNCIIRNNLGDGIYSSTIPSNDLNYTNSGLQDSFIKNTLVVGNSNNGILPQPNSVLHVVESYIKNNGSDSYGTNKPKFSTLNSDIGEKYQQKNIYDNGAIFSDTKFNSQGVAWNTIPSLVSEIYQGSSTDRPEISWYRGARTYPEFSIRQHTNADNGGEIYVGDGISAPFKVLDINKLNVQVFPTKVNTNTGTNNLVVFSNGVATANGAYSIFTEKITSYSGIESGITNTSNITGLGIDNLRNNNSTPDSGTLAISRGIDIRVGNTNTGTSTPITTVATALQATIVSSSGSITDAYGLRIDETLGSGTITNKYGIFESLTSSYNYLNSNLGLGVTSPTARLEISSGTTTRAPLRLTAGTNLTTPVNGTLEFDGTNLYFTVGGVRKTINLI